MVEKTGGDVFSRPFNRKAFERMHPGLRSRPIKTKDAGQAAPPAPTKAPVCTGAFRQRDWTPPLPEDDKKS